MSTDFNSNPTDPVASDSETPMFAPIPSWERGKKRRGFGSGRTSRVAAEPRSFTAETPATGAAAGAAICAMPAEDLRPYETRRTDLGAVDPTDTTFAAAPAYASRTAARKNSSAPIAIAAGIVLLGGLAAAGWYYTQPHTQGVAELTPGQASTTTTTDVAQATPPADAAAAAAPSRMAQNTAPPPAARATTTTTTTHHVVAPPVRAQASVSRTQVRTHRAASTADVSADASTTAPVRAAPAPTPAPAAPATAAAAPAPLVLNIPPAAPAPTQAAPQPATPPN